MQCIDMRQEWDGRAELLGCTEELIHTVKFCQMKCLREQHRLLRFPAWYPS